MFFRTSRTSRASASSCTRSRSSSAPCADTSADASSREQARPRAGRSARRGRSRRATTRSSTGRRPRCVPGSRGRGRRLSASTRVSGDATRTTCTRVSRRRTHTAGVRGRQHVPRAGGDHRPHISVCGRYREGRRNASREAFVRPPPRRKSGRGIPETRNSSASSALDAVEPDPREDPRGRSSVASSEDARAPSSKGSLQEEDARTDDSRVSVLPAPAIVRCRDSASEYPDGSNGFTTDAPSRGFVPRAACLPREVAETAPDEIHRREFGTVRVPRLVRLPAQEVRRPVVSVRHRVRMRVPQSLEHREQHQTRDTAESREVGLAYATSAAAIGTHRALTRPPARRAKWPRRKIRFRRFISHQSHLRASTVRIFDNYCDTARASETRLILSSRSPPSPLP